MVAPSPVQSASPPANEIARALAYVASYHANTGNAEAAMTMLDRAVALGPNDKHVHFFGAITYTALGDFDRALESGGGAGAFGKVGN